MICISLRKFFSHFLGEDFEKLFLIVILGRSASQQVASMLEDLWGWRVS